MSFIHIFCFLYISCITVYFYPIGELSSFAGQYADVLHKAGGFPAVICDRDHVISVSGIPKKELLERRVSPALEEIMEQRRNFAMVDRKSTRLNSSHT